jgi:hypothetical protein
MGVARHDLSAYNQQRLSLTSTVIKASPIENAAGLRVLRQFPGSIEKTNLLMVTTVHVDPDPKSGTDVTNVQEYSHGTPPM